MVTVLVDTSALFALLDETDQRHPSAVDTFERLGEQGVALASHSYVVTEAIALLQRRVGTEAVRRLVDAILPVVDVTWVDRPLHERAVATLLIADRRGLSIVDHVSFTHMRDRDIRSAFAFDRDFVDQGFEVVPAYPPGRTSR